MTTESEAIIELDIEGKGHDVFALFSEFGISYDQRDRVGAKNREWIIRIPAARKDAVAAWCGKRSIEVREHSTGMRLP